MSDVVDFIQARGEYASLFAVALLLWLSARPSARLLGLPQREVTDLLWNGGIAFVVAGRVAYLADESPRTLLDPLVLIRLQGGIEPLAGVVAVAAVVAWRARRRDDRWAWATAGAAGLAVTVVGYDLACVLRDACFGTTAPAPIGFRMSGLSETRLATPLVEATLLLALAAALLAFVHRLRAEALPLLLVAALALLRAALTPVSVFGSDAVGPATILLLLVGIGAILAAVALLFRVPERLLSGDS